MTSDFMKLSFLKRKKQLEILTYGNSVLKKNAEPITEINDDIIKVGAVMINSMIANNGIGLAGPQVGISLRIVTLAIPETKPEDQHQETTPGLPLSPGEAQLLPRMPLVLINPQIISFSPNKCTQEEGCLSVPDVYAEVTRPESVVLHSKFLNGEEITIECGGLLGRAVQHEIDHLDGVLFVDHLGKSVMKKIKDQLRDLKKRKPIKVKPLNHLLERL